MLNLNDPLTQTIGAGLIGLPPVWLIISRIWVKALQNNTEASASSATMEVIDALREEVSRLRQVNGEMLKLNGEMFKAISDLQREKVSLRNEISELHCTINEMREQISVMSRRKPPTRPYNGIERRHGVKTDSREPCKVIRPVNESAI